MQKLKLREYKGKYDPVCLYTQVFPKFISESMAYVSGPITSGPFKDKNPDTAVPEIIRENSLFGSLLLDVLARVNSNQQVLAVLPHELGGLYLPTHNGHEVKWKEHTYLTFWTALLPRMTPQLMEKFRKIIDQSMVDFSVFNDHSLAPSERIPQYQALEQVIVSFYAVHNDQLKPIEGFWRLPGAGTSLGSKLEHRMAAWLKIPIFNISLNYHHPELQNYDVSQCKVFLLLQSLGLLDYSGDPHLLAALEPCSAELNQ